MIIPDLWTCQMTKTVNTCFCFDSSPLSNKGLLKNQKRKLELPLVFKDFCLSIDRHYTSTKGFYNQIIWFLIEIGEEELKTACVVGLFQTR